MRLAATLDSFVLRCGLIKIQAAKWVINCLCEVGEVVRWAVSL